MLLRHELNDCTDGILEGDCIEVLLAVGELPSLYHCLAHKVGIGPRIHGVDHNTQLTKIDRATVVEVKYTEDTATSPTEEWVVSRYESRYKECR